VVVNGSGNGISCITWTQGKKGARSILEKRSSPRCSPSLGKSFMHLLVCVLEFLAHKFQKQPRIFFEFHGVVGSCYVIAESFISFMFIML
jgi:hypothetical protein